MQPSDHSPPTRPAPRPVGADRLDPKTLASGRREAMRRRAAHIRRSVTGLALALFAAAFLAVYVQLASGHDPALTAAAKRHTTITVAADAASSSGVTSSAGDTSTSAEPTTTTNGSNSSSSSSSSSSEASKSASAVTSSQS